MASAIFWRLLIYVRAAQPAKCVVGTGDKTIYYDGHVRAPIERLLGNRER
jgi:hypothetical protein